MLSTKVVARKISSFDHFIYLWGTRCNYYVPPKHCLSWRYISQVLAGEKRFLKFNEVGNCVEIPKAKGMVIRELWNILTDDVKIKTYFPDFSPSDTIPRGYFFNVN